MTESTATAQKQIVHVTVLPNPEVTVEVMKLVSQERVQRRTSDQVKDVFATMHVEAGQPECTGSWMCQLSVYQFMAEIGVPQITAASGSRREANNSNTRQCSKRKKQREARKEKDRRREKKEQGEGGHEKEEAKKQ